ncbi:MAG TPA: hypothetical protein VGX92_21080 [Pyrinomonadaceae bacterium]|jgi:hypothetical protein|nr:hypothetical protein [Pyrinomonadaceae bacterium]
MNSMNMPGFTAETSLYKTGGRYQMISSAHRVELNAMLVQPSLAIYMDGRFVCDGEVTDRGFINCNPPGGFEGGGGEVPEAGQTGHSWQLQVATEIVTENHLHKGQPVLRSATSFDNSIELLSTSVTRVRRIENQ